MELSKEQSLALGLVKQGKNVFISGKAGTGKSFLINEIKKTLKNKYVVLAPTGIAASNVKGQTIHSFFSIKPFGILSYDDANYVKTWKRNMYDEVQTIIIDEISMVRPDIIDCIWNTLVKNNCNTLDTKQLIFVGDLKQLQSILKKGHESTYFYKLYKSLDFRSAHCLQDIDIEEIELNTIFRQKENSLISALNEVRETGKSSYFDRFNSNVQRGIVLCATNNLCNYINDTALDKLPGSLVTIEGEIKGEIKENDTIAPFTLNIKDGCKVMYLRNEDCGLTNGNIGEVEIQGKNLYFHFEDKKYKIEPVKFEVYEYVMEYGNLVLNCKGYLKQYPIKPCYALSVHKAQGLSLDEITIDLSENMFAENQFYVALSRVKTEKGLNIMKRNEDYFLNKDYGIRKLLGY